MKRYFTGADLPRGLFIATITTAMTLVGQAATSQITTVEKRRGVVESAVKLAKPGVAAPLPENLALPFGPPGFELTEAQERAAAAAASGKTTAVSQVGSDREILEQLAAKIPPTGTMFTGGGEAILTLGNKTVKIGARFTVNLNGQDYDLELVKIDRTTFTLRYNRAEITRPINPAAAKSQ
jgi:hypothetical protein